MQVKLRVSENGKIPLTKVLLVRAQEMCVCVGVERSSVCRVCGENEAFGLFWFFLNYKP